MKTAARLFVSSMLFSTTIAIIYWFTTFDVIGVVFLGVMAVALFIVAGYILLAERNADLTSDKPDADPRSVAGERLGSFTTESSWPIIAAIGSAALLGGVVFLPSAAIAVFLSGAALLAWSAGFLIRESN